jgi:uncharacterized membrane protein
MDSMQFILNINFNNFVNKYKMSYQDLIPLVLTEIVGDFGYKVFANQGGVIPFATGTIGYVGVVYFLHLLTFQTPNFKNYKILLTNIFFVFDK